MLSLYSGDWMRKLAATLLLTLGAMPAFGAADRYSLHDAGDFAPSGQRVEFSDRYGWVSYKADFEFGMVEAGHALTRDSKLALSVKRRNGKTWSYTCKAKSR